MKTITTSCIAVVTAVLSFVGLGSFTSALAGPESLYGASNDKIQMVQAPEDPKWFGSVAVGTDFDTGATDFSNGFQQSFSATLGTNGLLGTGGGLGQFIGGELDIRGSTWNSAYSNFYRVQGEVGYRLNPRIEVYSLFKYTRADAEDLNGSHYTAFYQNGNLDFPVENRFSDYKAYGFELGGRYFFLPKESPIRPYVSLNAGVVYTECISLHSSANIYGQEVTIFDGGFYNDSITATGSLLLGLESRITRRFSVGVDAGLRYESTLCPNDAELEYQTWMNGISLSNVSKLNEDAGDRVIVPVSFFAKLRF